DGIRDFHVTGVQTCALPICNSNAVFGINESLIYGATLTALANPFIQWEETITSNFGFEFGLFEERLTGELDYYYRRTNDILVARSEERRVGKECWSRCSRDQ